VEVKEIMFGLGDEAPAPDTVGLMEDILIEYLHETVCDDILCDVVPTERVCFTDCGGWSGCW